MKPNTALSYITPDTVAECWDGVGQELYRALWGCVPHYDTGYRAHIEDIGPADVIGINSVASFWDRFTPEQQSKLNELAEKEDR